MPEPAIGTLLPAFLRRAQILSAAITRIEEKQRSNSAEGWTENSVPHRLQSLRQMVCAWPCQGRHVTRFVDASVWVTCVTATTSAVLLIHRSAIIVDLGSLLAASA
jgi:hypothetical protein